MITNQEQQLNIGVHNRGKLSLEVTNIYKYFGSIFSATQVKKGKPHPDIFLYASKKMGFKPDHCIVVEDSDHGVQAALAAGMKPLLYSTAYGYFMGRFRQSKNFQ
ncbi:MAG: HAD-IA family hydrolase [Chryseotalea sp. WA131a]|nr:MAG: HAD-IA family hydrolase [Chryseotalea sp. WA131a]